MAKEITEQHMAPLRTARQRAIKAATTAGKDWKKLTVEERRNYLNQPAQGS